MHPFRRDISQQSLCKGQGDIDEEERGNKGCHLGSSNDLAKDLPTFRGAQSCPHCKLDAKRWGLVKEINPNPHLRGASGLIFDGK
jgi:hypothetical protein